MWGSIVDTIIVIFVSVSIGLAVSKVLLELKSINLKLDTIQYIIRIHCDEWKQGEREKKDD